MSDVTAHRLRVDDLSVTYRVGKQSTVCALDRLSFSLNGSSMAVVGPSGSGKSTLLRALAQSVDYDGRITIDAQPLDKTRRAAVVFQDGRLIDFLTVSENIRLAAELHRADSSPARVKELLHRVNLSDLGSRMPETLSGGQRQRVAVARAIAMGLPLVLADEPTASLDRANSELIAQLLAELSAELGVLMIVATHDHVVGAAMDERLVLRDGRRVTE